MYIFETGTKIGTKNRDKNFRDKKKQPPTGKKESCFS